MPEADPRDVSKYIVPVVGQNNSGATCHFNALIQVLLSCRYLLAMIDFCQVADHGLGSYKLPQLNMTGISNDHDVEAVKRLLFPIALRRSCDANFASRILVALNNPTFRQGSPQS